MLHLAVENESIDIVKALLSKNNIDINIKKVYNEDDDKIEKTALIIAIEKKNPEMVDLLLQHPKIDVNMKKIYKNTYEIDDNDYVLNTKETPALFLAVMQKNPKIVKLLLSKDDIDVNSKYKKITYEPDKKGEFSIEKSIARKQHYIKLLKKKILK